MSNPQPAMSGEPDDLFQRGYAFARGQWYSIGKYREYEHTLCSARLARPLFSDAVRFGTAPWTSDESKLRQDEVLPLLAFAEHTGVAYEVNFCVEPFGQDSVVDASIRSGEICSNYQIATAGMSWLRPDGRRSRHGNDRRNANETMRDGRAVPGYSAFEKSRDGISYDEMARPTSEIVEAFRLGLLDTLAGKLGRSTKRTLEINQHSVELLVCFGDVGQPESIFIDLFGKALLEVRGKVGISPFPRTHVFGRAPGSYWSF